MPFTLAHPAAVLPLIRLARRRGARPPTAALVIGSMAPDAAYLLPGGLARLDGHSLPGLFAVSLPLGLAILLLFRWLAQRPLLDLLPPLGRRIAPDAGPPAWGAALGALLLGALTHVAWDAFTHGDGAGVLLIPALGRELFAVDGYAVAGYKLLQHGGGLAGCAALLWRGRRWLQAAPIMRPAPAGRWRPAVLALLAGCAVAAALLGVGPALFAAPTLGTARPLIGRAAVGGLAGLAWGLLIYAAGWQIAFRRRGDSPL